ncbi:MAG TPA: hypothetical protein PLF96_11960 [Thermotogota bacterium]|nr:hypothetical protein [Thermotogota bacterium]
MPSNKQILEEKAQALVEFLRSGGWEVRGVEAKSEYHFKVTFSKGKPANLYYKPSKKRFTWLPEGNDAQWNAKLLQAWENFEASKPTSPGAPFNPEEVRYYYNILRPYRNLRFDFSLLAEALNRVAAQSGGKILPLPPGASFDEMEKRVWALGIEL